MIYIWPFYPHHLSSLLFHELSFPFLHTPFCGDRILCFAIFSVASFTILLPASLLDLEFSFFFLTFYWSYLHPLYFSLNHFTIFCVIHIVIYIFFLLFFLFTSTISTYFFLLSASILHLPAWVLRYCLSLWHATSLTETGSTRKPLFRHASRHHYESHS